ncbi:hypothetical protein LUZ60_003587 [Juncus effusus]|nr:hypothetical protein LUZ60_003587 [Juncus effusus]
MASKFYFSKSLLSSCRLILRQLTISYRQRRITKLPKHTSQKEQIQNYQDQTLVLDLEGGLLRSTSTFPYFMIVALEAGSFIRSFVLLSLYPLLYFLNIEMAIRVMTVVSFFGLKEEKINKVGRAILPKYLLEDVGMEGLEFVRARMMPHGIMCVTGMPLVMVENFVKEYIGEVGTIVGKEVKMIGGYYVGFVEGCKMEKKLGLGFSELQGFGYSSMVPQHGIFNLYQGIYSVSEAEKRKWQPLQIDQYPKPLVFHDGRVAFRPTPLATLAMFMWVPLGILLSLVRTLMFVTLPYKISISLEAFCGVRTRVLGSGNNFTGGEISGKMFVCNHRTLLDPIYISAVLNRRLSAVTYSVSKITEILSPIKTIRLTRNREEDKRRMEMLLKQGDLVVCPEGTTCREPYLLRFSSLFAEVVKQVHPVALLTKVSMFYGTSTGSFKCLDHFYFLMNPSPEYNIEFLERMSTRSIYGKSCTSFEAANHVQSEIGRVLGFGLTRLTRKDKYLKLAKNEGYI